MAFIIFDSLRKKGEFSLNNNRPACSKCGFSIPFEDENPRTRWQCPVCGVKIGFWEKSSPVAPRAALPEVKDEQSARDFKNPLDEKGRTPVERVLHDDKTENEEVERDEH